MAVGQYLVRTGEEPEVELSPVYNAVCSELHNGGIGWMGDDRDSREEAEEDCRKHSEKFPEHECIVLEYL